MAADLDRVADLTADVRVRHIQTGEQHRPQVVDVWDVRTHSLTSQHVDKHERWRTKEREDLPSSTRQLSVDVREPDGGDGQVGMLQVTTSTSQELDESPHQLTTHLSVNSAHAHSRIHKLTAAAQPA